MCISNVHYQNIDLLAECDCTLWTQCLHKQALRELYVKISLAFFSCSHLNQTFQLLPESTGDQNFNKGIMGEYG